MSAPQAGRPSQTSKTALEQLVEELTDDRRLQAGSELAGDLDHWVRATELQRQRILNPVPGASLIDGWADAELFTFALACVHRGLHAAAVLCDAFDSEEPFRRLVDAFNASVPGAKFVRNRLTHFDEWGLRPHSNVWLTRGDDGSVQIQVGRGRENKYAVIDVGPAADAARKYAAAAVRKLLSLQAAQERSLRPSN